MPHTVLKMSAAIVVLTAFSLAGCQASTSTAESPFVSQKTETQAVKADKSHAKANKDQTKTEKKPAAPKLKLHDIGHNLHVIFGPGGNVGVSKGADGVVIIDDKFERNSDEVLSLLASLTDEPLRFVMNTHYHGDHTGGNGRMKSTGATIVAHDNVRKRMSMRIENKLFNRTSEPAPKENWPSVTFSGDMTFHMNGHTVTMLHTPGHTDGDSLIYFKEANVIHMGDNFFNGLFPYIDIDAGGSVAGMIAAHDRALSLADDNTQIIPGHGPMATPADLQKARDMLVDIMARVKARIDAGDSLETLIESNILQDYADYARFINEDKMIRIAHRSLSNK